MKLTIFNKNLRIILILFIKHGKMITHDILNWICKSHFPQCIKKKFNLLDNERSTFGNNFKLNKHVTET